MIQQDKHVVVMPTNDFPPYRKLGNHPELFETEYEEIKGVMWIVRKNNEDLTSDERRKLACLFEYSPELKLA